MRSSIVKTFCSTPGSRPCADGHDPDLDESHRLGLARVLLRVPGAAAERHALHRAGRQRTGRAAHVVLVAERPLDDVGEALDVAVGVHRPDRARDQPVVVEHPQRAELHVLGVVVGVERVVPARAEPAAVDVADLVVAPDRDRHGGQTGLQQQHRAGEGARDALELLHRASRCSSRAGRGRRPRRAPPRRRAR